MMIERKRLACGGSAYSAQYAGTASERTIAATETKNPITSLDELLMMIMVNQVLFGDNQEVLASDLVSSYKGRVRVVYIDPPYNTQTEKSYCDKIESGKWGDSMKKLLEMLKCFLAENGVIFISIDDAEYSSLKIICDSVFGKPNFVGTFITMQAQRSNSKHINTVHEYILCYAKNKTRLNSFAIKRIAVPEDRKMIEDMQEKVYQAFNFFGSEEAKATLKELISYYCKKRDITWLSNYNCIDEDGRIFFPCDLSVPSNPRVVDIPEIGLHLDPLKSRGWVSDKRFVELHEKKLLAFKDGRPYQKKFLSDASDNVSSVLNFYSRQGTNDLNKLGLRDLFDTPKPVDLIKFLIRIVGVGDQDVILDCFAGSGTTGQAVFEVNREDNKELSFVLIQKKEEIQERNKIYKSCLQYGIKPFVSEILKLRLETMKNKIAPQQNIEYIDYEQYIH